MYWIYKNGWFVDVSADLPNFIKRLTREGQRYTRMRDIPNAYIVFSIDNDVFIAYEHYKGLHINTRSYRP